MASQPEHDLQASVSNFLKAHLPADMAWTAVETGIKAGGTPQQRMHAWNKQKARGIHAGVHDLPIIYWHGVLLSIELKFGDNKPSDEQLAWGVKIKAQGGHVAYCWTRREVLDAFDAAFGDDNPLRHVPPGLVSRFLAYDAEPVRVKKVRRPSKPRVPKPTRRAVAVGERFRRGFLP